MFNYNMIFENKKIFKMLKVILLKIIKRQGRFGLVWFGNVLWSGIWILQDG